MDKPNTILYKLKTFLWEKQSLRVEAIDISYCIKQCNSDAIWPIILSQNGKKIQIEDPLTILELQKTRPDNYTFVGKQFPLSLELKETTIQYDLCQDYLGDLFDNISTDVELKTTKVPQFDIYVMIYDHILQSAQLNFALKQPELQGIVQQAIINKYWPFLQQTQRNTKYNVWRYDEMLAKEECSAMAETRQKLPEIVYIVEYVNMYYKLEHDLNTFLLFNSITIDNEVVELLLYYNDNGQNMVAIKQKQIVEEITQNQLDFNDTLVILYKNGSYCQVNTSGDLMFHCSIKPADNAPSDQPNDTTQYPKTQIFDSIKSLIQQLYATSGIQISGAIRTNQYVKLQAQIPTNDNINAFKLQQFLAKLKQSAIFTEDSFTRQFHSMFMGFGKQTFNFIYNMQLIILDMSISSIFNGNFVSDILFSKIKSQTGDIPEAGAEMSTLLASKQLYKNDPVLFDDVSGFYTRLCQGDHKPLLAKESEKNDKYVKQYWNFTQNRVQYYKCNEKYPILAFNKKRHPRGLCVPCCSGDIKNALKHEKARISCMEKNIKEQEQAKQTTSYVLTQRNKFKEGRLTLLQLPDPALVVGGSGKSYIHCVTLPTIGSILKQIYSLVDSVVYLLKNVKQFDNSRAFIVHLRRIFFQQGNTVVGSIFEDIMFNKMISYSLQDIISYISTYLMELKLSMAVIDGDTDKIDVYDTNQNQFLVFYTYNGIYNPIVYKQAQLIYTRQSLSFVKRDTDRRDHITPDMYKLPILGQIIDEVNRCIYVVCEWSDGRALLPVTPQLRIHDQPILNNTIELTEINNNSDIIAQLIDQLKTSVSTVIVDASNSSDNQALQGVTKSHSDEQSLHQIQGLICNNLYFAVTSGGDQLLQMYRHVNKQSYQINLLQNIITIAKTTPKSINMAITDANKKALWALYEQQLFNLIVNNIINSAQKGVPLQYQIMDEKQLDEEIAKHSGKQKILPEFTMLSPCGEHSNNIFCARQKIKILKRLKPIFTYLTERQDIIDLFSQIKSKNDLTITFNQRNFVDSLQENFRTKKL